MHTSILYAATRPGICRKFNGMLELTEVRFKCDSSSPNQCSYVSGSVTANLNFWKNTKFLISTAFVLAVGPIHKTQRNK